MQNILRIPKRINLFVVLTLIVFLTPFIMQITGNNYIKLIEDIAYMIMLLHSIYIMLFHNKIIIKKSIPMIIFTLLFIISSAIGVYYNGLTIVILQYREFKYLLLLIILIPYSDKEYFKPVWTVFKAIAVISIPVSIIQVLIYGNEGDRITGLFGYGGSGTLTLFVLIVFSTELGMRLLNNQRIFGLYFLYLIPTLLNETKITFVLIPILLIVPFLLAKKIKSKQFVIFIVLSVAFITIFAIIYESRFSNSIFEVFSSEYLDEYLFATDWIGDAGRFAKVQYAYKIIKNTNLLFGYGLGASYSGSSSGVDGYIYERYYTPEMFGGTKPQLFLSLIDLGLLGLFLLFILLVVIIIKFIKMKNMSTEKLIVINSFIVLFVTLPYQNIFYTYQIMYMILLYTNLLSKENSVCENKMISGVYI